MNIFQNKNLLFVKTMNYVTSFMIFVRQVKELTCFHGAKIIIALTKGQLGHMLSQGNPIFTFAHHSLAFTSTLGAGIAQSV
jgi:hypothetical protein